MTFHKQSVPTKKSFEIRRKYAIRAEVSNTDIMRLCLLIAGLAENAICKTTRNSENSITRQNLKFLCENSLFSKNLMQNKKSNQFLHYNIEIFR